MPSMFVELPDETPDDFNNKCRELQVDILMFLGQHPNAGVTVSPGHNQIRIDLACCAMANLLANLTHSAPRDTRDEYISNVLSILLPAKVKN